jgi:NAD(P)-dependent dehydrogenase (short-subunit alcohol dehydrogenase family)
MKTVLITGGNSGIGLATAKSLAGRGFRVFIAARDLQKSEAALKEIAAAVPGAQAMALQLDLGDLEKVRAFAADFRARVPELDVLILNAGLFPTTKQMTAQGFEQQFGVNHLGHFLLANLLLDSVKARKGRVVVVSSIMHWLGHIDFASFRGEKRYNPVFAYGQSKLANVLFAQELARRLEGSGVTVNALHPGGVDTGIARDLPRFMQKLYAMLTVSVEKGAETSVFLASAPEAAGYNGLFFRNCKPMRVSPLARRDTAEKLWQASEELADCRY